MANSTDKLSRENGRVLGVLIGPWRDWAAGTPVTTVQGLGQNLLLLVLLPLGYLHHFVRHLEGLGGQSKK